MGPRLVAAAITACASLSAAGSLTSVASPSRILTCCLRPPFAQMRCLRVLLVVEWLFGKGFRSVLVALFMSRCLVALELCLGYYCYECFLLIIRLLVATVEVCRLLTRASMRLLGSWVSWLPTLSASTQTGPGQEARLG